RWLAIIGVVDTRQPSINCGVELPRSHRGTVHPAERRATYGCGINRAGEHVGGSRRINREILGVAEVKALLPTPFCGRIREVYGRAHCRSRSAADRAQSRLNGRATCRDSG